MGSAERKPHARLEWGLASQAVSGESVSGDLSLVQTFPGGALLAVVDGLGHGSEATAASELAVSVLRSHPKESVLALVERCHAALRQTRGAVMSLASFREADAALTWMGVGNVEGVLIRSDPSAVPPRETILLRGGVVGFQLPIPRAAVIPVCPGDLLLFATDGVQHGFDRDVSPDEPPQQCADRVLAQNHKSNDDALVLVARLIPAENG